jgi:hypothetical protein
MQPAPAHMSGVLSDLWQDVVSAADIADLAQKFSAFRLDLMPHFAAFFWAEDGMHSLVRGGLRAVDAETGDVVAEGEGFHTWNEVGLQSVRQVRIDMDELGDEPVLALPLAVGVVLASSITLDSTQKVQLVLPTVAAAPVEALETPDEEPAAEVEAAEESGAEAPAGRSADEVEAPEAPVVEPAVVVPIVPIVSEHEPEADVVPPEPFAGDAEPVAEEPVAEEPDAEAAPEEPGSEAAPEEPSHGEDVPEAFAAEPSLPIETHDSDQQEPAEDPSEVPFDENLDDSEEPYQPTWPAHSEPQGDAWGVRSAEALAPVDLFVDEDEDGVPDAQQSSLDLGSEPADTLAAPDALDVAAPAPQGPPPGWNQPSQSPYGQPQPGQYGPPQGLLPSMPFAAPGLPGSQYPQPPSLPGRSYPGQPYPGQPFSDQPVQGQSGQYGQQPTYPPSPQYGGPSSPNGAPLTSPLVSPVPPPAAYAPAAPLPQGPGAPSEPGSDTLILAVMCSFGHPNPPGSPRCRRCGQPVDNANPRLVHKPVLAQLITAGGARIEVTDTVLIGRAPSAQPGDGNPILLPIPSPNSDISRTHLKVAVKDWDIIATDLHSTNGTMLVRPGQAPVRMMAGTPVTVDPGTILDLGDGGVITVGLPA